LQSLRRHLRPARCAVSDGPLLSAGTATSLYPLQVPVQSRPSRPGTIHLPRAALYRFHEDACHRKSNVIVYFAPLPGRDGKCDQCICMSVCPLAYREFANVQISPNFLHMLLVAVAQYSSDGNAICYVLSVLWMTTCFYIMQGIGQNQRRSVCFVHITRWRHQSHDSNVVSSISPGVGTRGEVCRSHIQLFIS